MGNLYDSIKLALSPGQDPRPKVKNPKPASFKIDDGRISTGTTFEVSPYDFSEIDNAIDTDSFAQQIMLRKLYLMWKEGYSLKGPNPDALNYIQMRFKLLGIAQGQSFGRLMIESSDNLMRYNNIFLVKARDDKPRRITGMRYKGLDDKDPVAGYSQASIHTISIKRDKYNRPKKYKQTSAGFERQFSTDEMLHVAINRTTGTRWGKPTVTQAIEDVRSFRIIEEDALNLVHKEMYPVYKYKIGDELRPPEQEDITKAKLALENLYEDGGLVMAGKDDLDTVGSGQKTIDVKPYVDHFKERAIVGWGIAPYQIGISEDLNKAAIERLDVIMYDQIKSYQRDMADFINNEIIFELLLEGGYDPIGFTKKEADTVEFEFNEIDVEAQIARENHTSVLWLQNMITHGEMREDLGMKVIPENKDMYHIDMVELVVAREASAAQLQGGTNPQSPAKGPSSKDQPSNQHGKKRAPKVAASTEEANLPGENHYYSIEED